MLRPFNRFVKYKDQILWCVILFQIGVLAAQHRIINSGWEFQRADNSEWQTVNLPHTYNQNDAFDDIPGYYRGKAFYKKYISLSELYKDKIHYLKFNAINQHARVKINGQHAAEHKGGYTAFAINITPYIKYDSPILIEVEVDNSHDINIPPLDADFTFYGGIYREVELISLSKQHFSLSDYASDGYYIRYKEVSSSSAKVEIDAIIENFDSQPNKFTLEAQLFDKEHRLVSKQLKSSNLIPTNSSKITLKLPEVENPKLWSPETPYLYSLQLRLKNSKGEVLQTKTSNIGFRYFSIDSNEGFFLNGQALKLIGVNRHQDFQGLGNAVPIEIQLRDIEKIKEMGTNFIRFAHYPHARALYEKCDELGILVWTEIPVVNKVTDSPEFFGTSLTMQEEHIKQYFNHPSVVMFGYMNEIFLRLAFDNKSSDLEKQNLKSSSLNLAKQLEGLTRRLAPDHLTVMALHFNEVYNETGIADLPMVLGWNLYFGWYHDTIEDLGKFMDDQHKRYPERALFLSEYGPGADDRIFTKTPKIYDFSTDYQYLLHHGYLKQVKAREYIMGMTAWNYADFGSEFRGDAIPHVNQKGLVNYDRIPKDVYYYYKANLNNSDPFIHIASDKIDGLSLVDESTYPIQIFSNQKNADLYINDTLIENLNFNDGQAKVQIPLKNGTNKLVVRSQNIDETKTIRATVSDLLDFKDFDRLAINLGSHFYFRDKEMDLIYIPDKKYDGKHYGYLNGITFKSDSQKNQGIPYDIKNTKADPLFQTMLMGCEDYRLDIANGDYKLSLFFVEPQIKPTENLYALNTKQESDTPGEQRIFDIYINDELFYPKFNMANEFPEKYGITLECKISIWDGKGLRINLKPIQGDTVISGLMLEKL